MPTKKTEEHSEHFALVKKYYDRPLWSKARVHKAVKCKWITADEYKEITGEEYKRQNQRKGELDLKREERKQAEVDERAQRDRERSQMEGRIAAQMERSNTLIEGMKTLMESVVASNDVLHADLVNSQARSQGMAEKVDHIYDRVDLMYNKETGR